MRIILTIGAALVVGSAMLHAEPARCQGGCGLQIICIGGAGGCQDGCWCNATKVGEQGVCVGPGR